MVIFHRYVSYQRVTAKMMEKLKPPNSASLSTKPAKKIGLCTKPAHQQLPTSNETFAPVPVCVKWVLCPSTCRCGMLPVE